MSNSDTQPRTLGLLRLLLLFSGSDWAEVFIDVWRLGKRMLGAKAHEGMYEVLEQEVQLELLDERGEMAIYRKRQRVRFLQDNTIAYQDKAWGDGEIFANYKCSPGVAVDQYREGHHYCVLISLRETKKRDDVEEFRIERTIKNGFTKPVEDLQIEIEHPTKQMVFSVVFPTSRLPKEVVLIEKHLTRTTPLEVKHRSVLPDGRHQWSWTTAKPRLFEAYILRWEW